MDKVACQLKQKERNELFVATAGKMKTTPNVVEKDFWVCWVLKRIFSSDSLKDHMVFKGGTSLSKVYGLIERFSEDIDLILDWRLLGYEADVPNHPQPSRTKQDRFNKKVVEESSSYIKNELTSKIQSLLDGADCTIEVAPDDPNTINVSYPAAFPDAYIRPQVRLEIGPLAKWIPSKWRTIQPYAFEHYPTLFEDGTAEVFTIDAERTFWEKATILHQEAYQEGLRNERYSRHYYDLFRLGRSTYGESALRDLDLLNDVVDFKSRFYPSSKARYELAKPGSFRLVPSPEKIKALAKDYEAMKSMIFGEIPDFEEIMIFLRSLEESINLED